MECSLVSMVTSGSFILTSFYLTIRPVMECSLVAMIPSGGFILTTILINVILQVATTTILIHVILQVTTITILINVILQVKLGEVGGNTLGFYGEYYINKDCYCCYL
jgi:hypothetical protein